MITETDEQRIAHRRAEEIVDLLAEFPIGTVVSLRLQNSVKGQDCECIYSRRAITLDNQCSAFRRTSDVHSAVSSVFSVTSSDRRDLD